MQGDPYTLAKWQVRPGREEDFIRAWDQLAEVFVALPEAPLWGTLIRSESDPALFYSFGPWHEPEDITAMRADPLAQAAMERVRELCVEAIPGSFRAVRHVEV